MEFQDHAYTTNTCDEASPSEFTYKMVSKEVHDFVKLRMSNSYLFNGRRNASMWAWKAILEHMNLHHKMSHNQASKKWENMKKRYKELKNPPVGFSVSPVVWPYFSLMDDAMEGRLEGSAPIINALPRESGLLLPIGMPKKRKTSLVPNSPTASLRSEPEVEVSLNGDEDGEKEAVYEGNQEIDRIMREVEHERNMLESDRKVIEGEKRLMEMEKKVMEKEQQVLQRERSVLDREMAALDRARASLERERATMEREKAVMERERAMVEKDREAVSKFRAALEREKARLERLSAAKGRSEVTEDGNSGEDSSVDRKERLLVSFEKLLESF